MDPYQCSPYISLPTQISPHSRYFRVCIYCLPAATRKQASWGCWLGSVHTCVASVNSTHCRYSVNYLSNSQMSEPLQANEQYLRVCIKYLICPGHSGDSFLTHRDTNHITAKYSRTLISVTRDGILNVKFYNFLSHIYCQKAQFHVQSYLCLFCNKGSALYCMGFNQGFMFYNWKCLRQHCSWPQTFWVSQKERYLPKLPLNYEEVMSTRG